MTVSSNTNPTTVPELWLDPIHPCLREDAERYFQEGDVENFLFCASNDVGMEMVWRNFCALWPRGIYEEALLHAFVNCRVNHFNVGMKMLRWMFDVAKRDKLRALRPLPSDGPFTLYRGVSGRGAARRVRGMSWTSDFDRARWFAQRFSFHGSPAVHKAVVPAEHVLAYTDERNESEFIVSLPPQIKTKEVWTM